VDLLAIVILQSIFGTGPLYYFLHNPDFLRNPYFLRNQTTLFLKTALRSRKASRVVTTVPYYL
jgi:hypothetical protein